jgi:pyruvate,orthophosphate dikinase
MHAAEGILTSRGGMTSHAAVVARGMGNPLRLRRRWPAHRRRNGTLVSLGATLKAGDVITLDGSTGQVLKGAVAMLQPELSGDFGLIMEWADATRRMKVRTNAETPADARAARSFGAEGIGLCRTEHMFFDGDRITAMREMILAGSEGRPPHGAGQAAADAALGFHRAVRDHEGPAGHHPPARSAAARVPAQDRRGNRRSRRCHGVSSKSSPSASMSWHEFNPMLGHRGCRLAISYPEIAEMQARAIFEAAVEAAKSTGAPVVPEIMVPLVGLREELDFVKARIDAVAREVIGEAGVDITYLVGTMIELPRAAIRRPMPLPKWPSSSPSAPTT